jgi:hypothetical protein
MPSNDGSGVPSPSLDALPGIDALIAAQLRLVTQQGRAARQSLLQQRKALKQQTKQGALERKLLRQQIDALNVQPAPAVSTPNNPEVQLARRQVAVDASNRTGVRASIMAGETFSGSAGSPTRKSILG